MNGYYVLLYSMDQCRAQKTDTYGACMAFVDRWIGRLDNWALYRASYQGKRFHNATDSRYLVTHDDPYWHNVRFGQQKHAILENKAPWVFWALMMDDGGMFVRQIEETSSFTDVHEFSRHYHDIAWRHGFRFFTRDQSLIGGYFVARDGSCLYARPKGLRPYPELPER